MHTHSHIHTYTFCLQGGADHFMQKEIHEQPESLLQTMRGRVQFQRPAVSRKGG